jgi:hypothetical protein
LLGDPLYLVDAELRGPHRDLEALLPEGQRRRCPASAQPVR